MSTTCQYQLLRHYLECIFYTGVLDILKMMIATFCFLVLILHNFADDTTEELPENDDQIPESFVVVSLKKKAVVGDVYNHFCTGSILSKDWILTAGHCFSKKSYLRVEHFAVDAGSLHISGENGTRYPISEYIIHPNESESIVIYKNDLCLVRLGKPIKFTENVKAVQLGTIEDQKEVPAMAGGWGRVSQYGNLNSMLRWVEFKTLRYSECQRLHKPRNNMVDRETHICGFTGTTDTLCFGDSGGPIFDKATGKQVGVFSALEDCSGDYPVLFVKIEKYLDWINDVTKLGFTL